MKRLFLYASLIVTALAAGLWSSGALSPSAAPDRQQEKPLPVLVFDSRSLDIGEVWEDREFKHTVRVENRGTETVHVEGVSCSSCKQAVSAISPDKFELAPGAAQRVQLTLNLNIGALRGTGPHRFTAPLRLRYSMESKPGETLQSIGELRGAIKPVLVTHPVWNLGTHYKAGGPFEKRFEAVALTQLGSIEVEVLPPAEQQLSVSARRRPDKPNIFEIVVRSDGPANSGLHSGEIVLRPKTKDGELLPPKHVIIEVEFSDQDARISPAELYFGGTKIGSSVESLVSVSSLSGREIRVEGAEPVGAGLEVVPGVRKNEFRVRQRATQAGIIRGVVSFTVRTNDVVERVTLAVSAVGVEVADK